MEAAEPAPMNFLMANRMPLELAKDSARLEDGDILVISGSLPMGKGYPDDEHEDIVQLINLTAPGGNSRMVALYRILNRSRLHEVVDFMQEHGGYRCALVRPDGSMDQGYYL